MQKKTLVLRNEKVTDIDQTLLAVFRDSLIFIYSLSILLFFYSSILFVCERK